MSAFDASVVVRSMARPTLMRTLASIAAQCDVALEVIVVGACGAAHPQPPAAAGAHPLRFIASAVPLARAAAANAGLEAARGEWIILLDDDDEWRDGHLRGLLAGASAHPGAGVAHSLAEVHVEGEPVRPFGQPMALSELYRRNFICFGAALIARTLVREGVRCDEALEIHEDWDLFLQCAQRAPFHFVRQRTFVWNAGAGESGAGGGANLDAAEVDRVGDVVRGKWAAARAATLATLTPALRRASAAVQRGAFPEAATEIGDVLRKFPNEPDALVLMAAVERATGRLAQAQSAQALASLVRPDDAMLVYNLALICRERGDLAAVRDCAGRLARMAPQDPRATALASALDGT